MSSLTMDIEDVQATKTEKFLAGVLAVFLLIGGVWTYQRIDDHVAETIDLEAPVSAADEAALQQAEEARMRLDTANTTVARARRTLEFRREEYRTALDAGRTAPGLERAYRASQAALARAERERGAAEQAVQQTAPAAEEADRRRFEEVERRQDRRERYSFFVRLAFVVALLAVAFRFVYVLHRRRSRYLPIALGFLAFAVALSLVLAGDYLTDYFELGDPRDVGVLVLSFMGIAATLLVFALGQQYLARRLPARRVRRGECPFCGYPVRGTEHCERCGREVVAPCSRCSEPRRVGVARCGACGAT
jgi:hypothetical protein